MDNISPVAVLSRYSHHFVVNNIRNNGVMFAIDGFYGQFAHWQMIKRPDGTFGRAITKHFAVKTVDIHGKAMYRFHINTWDSFLSTLNAVGYGPTSFDVVDIPLYVAEDAKLEFNSPHTPRTDQLLIHDYLMNKEPISKLVTAQTGVGKTYMAARALCSKGKRVMLIIRPMFIEKWKDDLHKLCSVPKDRIKVISGGKELRSLLRYPTEDIPFDAIILSNKTLQKWLTSYTERGDGTLHEGFDITPIQLCERLGTNGYLVDERHMDFHLNFLMDLYTHAPETIALTATLISDDRFISKMQMILHPPYTRAKKAAYNVYARVSSFHYWFKAPERVRTLQYGNPNYSHTAFEDSIARDKTLCLRYFEMIRVALERYWNNKYKKEGDRALVFFATVNMCERFVEWLRPTYPHSNINKFTEGDPYSNLISSDIAVSTVLSAGTAHDIAQLTVAIMTLALKSSASNWQVIGRLRDLRDGRHPYLVYFVAEDFAKPVAYHIDKQTLFQSERLPCFSYGYDVRL